jgi:hypothetical protein
MGRAEELFHKLLDDKEPAIDDFIASRKAEELYLDFKRSSTNGSGTKLDQNNRNNLAKAISGFGNSEGGIVIWGVDCSIDIDGADVAKNKVYIENPTRFASWLNSVVSGCTIPPHANVRNEPILAADNQGFVITLIPKSNNTPHQVVKKLQYYIRAGSDFVPTPHDVLAGMFGRRPQPHIIPQFMVNPLQIYKDTISIQIGIMLKNLGPGIASDLFITCMIRDFIGDNCKIEFERNDSENWYGNFSLGIHLSLITKTDIKLPPDAFLVPITLHISMIPPINKDLSIKATIGCSNGRSYNFDFSNSAEKLQELHQECISKHRAGKLAGLEHEYYRKIINSNFENFID